MTLRAWILILIILALAGVAVAHAPAAYFVPQRPGVLTYGGVEGSIWRARFYDVRVAGYDARIVTWRLSAWDLLTGKAVADLGFSGGDINGEATLLAELGGDRRIVVPGMRLNGAPAERATGETRIQGLDIRFEDGRCAGAAGRIDTDVLEQSGQALGWTGPRLSGAAQCANDDAEITLAGDAVHARVLLHGDGRATWWVEARPTEDPEAESALLGAGFAPDQQGVFVRREEFRWLPL